MGNLEQDVGNLLRQKGLTLGVVESATGGLISHWITNVPGSSDYYKGSLTAYSNEIKIRVVGVKEDTHEPASRFAVAITRIIHVAQPPSAGVANSCFSGHSRGSACGGCHIRPPKGSYE